MWRYDNSGVAGSQLNTYAAGRKRLRNIHVTRHIKLLILNVIERCVSAFGRKKAPLTEGAPTAGLCEPCFVAERFVGHSLCAPRSWQQRAAYVFDSRIRMSRGIVGASKVYFHFMHEFRIRRTSAIAAVTVVRLRCKCLVAWRDRPASALAKFSRRRWRWNRGSPKDRCPARLHFEPWCRCGVDLAVLQISHGGFRL